MKNEGEPGAPGPPGGFPPGAGAPDADDDDDDGGDGGGGGGGRGIVRPQGRQQEPSIVGGARHGRIHAHPHGPMPVPNRISTAVPPSLTAHPRRPAHRADSIRSDVAVFDDDAVNPLLPENAQLDLLRQTQRRNRTTTDEMEDMPDRRGRAGAPALGLGALFSGQEPHHTGVTAPSSPQTLITGFAPPTISGRSPLPTRTPNTTPLLHPYHTHSAASPAPGEAFSPLGVSRPQNRSPAWSTVVQRAGGGRMAEMIPTAERTVSPLQPTFQIPVFGQGGSRGGQR